MQNENHQNKDTLRLTGRAKKLIAGVALAASAVTVGLVAHETDHADPTISYTVQSPDTNPTRLAEDLGAKDTKEVADLIANEVGGPASMNYGDQIKIYTDELTLPGIDLSAFQNENTELTRGDQGQLTPVDK